MEFQEFRRAFRERCENHSLWNHLFFRSLQTGERLKVLRHWAIQAGMIDQIFAGVLRTLINNPAIPTSAHQPLRENLNDELGNGNPAEEHFQLFTAVLHALGVDESDYREACPAAETNIILQGLCNAARGSDPIHALALMASEELICPAEFPRLISALKLMLPGNAWLKYFTVHCDADPKHSEDLIRQLYLATGGHADNVRHAFCCQEEDLTWNVAFYNHMLSFACETDES